MIAIQKLLGGKHEIGDFGGCGGERACGGAASVSAGEGRHSE
jgi:hypothetical protein